MQLKIRGFTLIEILVIIGVFGILFSIAVVSWTGVQTWSENNARAAELKQWASAFDLYKTRYAYYPGIPSANGTYRYCLGGFANTSNKCGEYTRTDSRMLNANDATAASIRTELAKIGKAIPDTSVQSIGGQVIGPYVQFTHTGAVTATVQVKFVALISGSSCPEGTAKETLSPGNPIAATYSGISSCTITKSMTYTP